MNNPGGMDPQARRFLAMVALGAGNAAEVTPEVRRRSFEKLMRFSQPPSTLLSVRDQTISVCRGEIVLRIYGPPETRDAIPGVVYFHGGGLVAGSLETHDALCRTLAAGVGCRLIAVGYRLAPEHPFPIPVLDALVAARWIVRHAATLEVAADSLVVAGDSGGATLTTIVAQVLRHQFKAQVLLCPVLDFVGTHVSKQFFGEGYLLDTATMARDLEHYAPSRSLDDPRVSPLQTPLRQLAQCPKTIIHTAGFDPLRDEGMAYAERLREAGVAVDFTNHAELIHHFYGLTAAIPAAQAALATIIEDIRKALA